MTRELSVSQLVRQICAARTGLPAAEACCEAFTTSGLDVIDSTSVPRGDLLRIYEVRLSKPPKGPPLLGAERMLLDLANYKGDEVTIVALPRGTEVFCLLLNATASQLVTCFVGQDRRLDGLML